MAPGIPLWRQAFLLGAALAASAHAAVWPMPSAVTSGASMAIMSPSFGFQCGDDACRQSPVLADGPWRRRAGGGTRVRGLFYCL